MSRALAVLGLLLLALGPWFLPPFYVTLFNYIGLSSLVTLGLVLLTGVGGLTSFGQAAFMGLGAYTTALLSTGRLEIPVLGAWLASPWAGLGVGLLLTLLVAGLLGKLTLRLQGHYLPLGTIAWGLSLYFLFATVELLGGYTGITNVPPIPWLGHALERPEQMHYLIWGFVVLAAWTTQNLLDSRPGRAIRALKGGVVMAEAMGVNTPQARLSIFVLAALQASAAGWLYAHLQRFVNPSPFSLGAGIDYLFMAVVGGAGQVWGAVLGATVLTVLRQWLQDLLPALLGRTGNFEVMVFGVLLILLLQRSRDGLWAWIAPWLPAARARAPKVVDAAARLPSKPMPAAQEVLLEARAVTRRFGGLLANNDMDLQLRAGEILALIGPNGAGKSTLFNQLSGVDTPTSGDVLFRGQVVTGRSSRDMAQLGLSRTFQHVRLLPRMSVLENAALGTHMRGHKGLFSAAWRLDRREEASLLAEAAFQLRRVGLGELMQVEAGALSLGQQRILEIARALASDPCVLLLDEPAAGLRHLEKQALGTLLQSLREQGMGILLVEHDMDFVMSLADRVVVMDYGSKITQGLPAEVQAHPAVLEAYLGGV